MKRFRNDRAVVIALLWIALALRLHQIDLQSWWWDEGYSTYLARSGIFAALQLTSVDIHPPLYYVLLSLWGTFAGYTEFTSRLLSTVFNLATIPLIYQVGKRSLNARTGVLAATILTFAPAHVYYAQEVRMYTLFALEYLVALGLLWRLMRAEMWDRRTLIALAITEAAMLYTHYFSAVGVAFINLAALVSVLRRPALARLQHLRQWIGTQVGAVMLYLPWLPFALRQSLAYEDDRAKPMPFEDFANLMWHFFNLGIRGAIGNPRRDPPHPEFIFASGAFGLLFVVGLLFVLAIWARRTHARARNALLFWLASFAIPLLLVFGLMFWKPTIHPRYVLMVTPALFLAVGAVLAGLFSARAWLRPLGIALGIALCAAIAATSVRGLHIVYGDPLYFRADARSTARYLSEIAQASDAIVIDSPDFTLEQYYAGRAPMRGIKMLAREAEGLAELQTLTQGKQQAFLVRWDLSRTDDRRFLPFLLERAGQLREHRQFHGYDVWRYGLERPVEMPALATAETNFGNVLRLRGSFHEPHVPSGEGIAIALAWELLAPTTRAYKVAVAIADEERRVLSNRDILLMDERHRYTFRWEPGLQTTTYHVVPVPLGTPPGTYFIMVSVYAEDEETGTIVHHLDVLDQAGNPAGQSFVIGTFDVGLPRDLADPYNTLAGMTGTPQPLGEGVTLRSALLPITRAAPGERVPVVLLLTAERAPLPNDPLTVEIARSETVLGAITAHAGNGRFPTAAWREGFPVLERRFVPIAPEAATGDAEVRVRWGKRPAISLGTITISGRARRFEPPAFSEAVGARYPDLAELVGATLVQAYDPETQRLRVSLVWRALNPVPLSREYVVSVQVLNTAGRLIGQSDHPPGFIPTSSWVAGEYIEDAHEVIFREPLRDEGRLIVVLYEAISQQRALTTEGHDAIVLPMPIHAGAR